MVVKSCRIDAALSLAHHGLTGVVDSAFAALSAEVAFPINLLHKADLAGMRALLLDGARCDSIQ